MPNKSIKQWIEKTKFIYSNLPYYYLISKIYERSKWKNFSNEKEVETSEDWERIEKSHIIAKEEYIDRISEVIMEFQRTGCYDLMHWKMNDLGWKKVMEFKSLASKPHKDV